MTSLVLSSHTLAETNKPKLKGDRPGHVMKDVIPKSEVPPAPILTVIAPFPAAGLKSITPTPAGSVA